MIIHRGEKFAIGGVLMDGEETATTAFPMVVQVLSKSLTKLFEQEFTIDTQQQQYVTVIDTTPMRIGVNYLRFILRGATGDRIINESDMEMVIYE